MATRKTKSAKKVSKKTKALRSVKRLSSTRTLGVAVGLTSRGAA